MSREIQNQIVLRNLEKRFTPDYTKLSAALKFRLKQLSDELNQLKQKLLYANHLTLDESERRQRQLELLQSKFIHLEKEFSFVPISSEETIHSGTGGNNNVSSMDRSEILQYQNNSLDALSAIISRQKNIAIKIGDEVEVQNNIIDNLAQQIDNNDVLINQETNHVVVVQKKDSTWSYWSIIICLFVAIVLIALIG